MATNLKEFDVSKLEDERNATVHGMVSPVKVRRNNPEVKYFNRKISDGKKVARIISFEPKLRSVLERSQENKRSLCP